MKIIFLYQKLFVPLHYKTITMINYDLLNSRTSEFSTKKADCVVRAFAIALNMDYKEAHEILKKRGRKDRCGTNVQSVVMGYKRARTIKGRLLVRKEYKRGITLERFVKKNPTGRFICIMSRHAFAVIEGKVYGQYQGCIIQYFIKVKLNGEDNIQLQPEILPNQTTVGESQP